MKTLYIILILAVLVIAFVFLRHKLTVAPTTTPTKTPASLTDGVYCYSRNQLATADAPYSVSENMKIYVSGNSVTGTKTGSQAGPDMTNGYAGSLVGTRDGDHLTVIFDYTIEGSNNREQEVYDWSAEALTKRRYVLKESGNMLVPDLTSTPQNIVYALASCVE